MGHAWLSRSLTPALAILAAVHIAHAASAGENSSRPTRPPNIVLILADDLGWADLGCYGGAIPTPHLDRLAREGARFTAAYSACTVCSPTRAAVLTGKYPARLHITDWIPGHGRPQAPLAVPDWTRRLPHEEITLAEMLKAAGYATAHIGKWHLGFSEHGPTTQGFDLNIAGTHAGQPPSYFFPYRRGRQQIETLEGGIEGEHLTDRLAREAVAFVEQHREQPFFLYWPDYSVHTPLEGKPELVETHRARSADSPRNPVYAAMVEGLDSAIGRLLGKIAELGLDDQTIVLFSSDNGGLTLGGVTTNAPLRDGKGSVYEGGVRVPLIVRYPPQVAAGQTPDDPVMSIDFPPTLLALAGLEALLPAPIDGVDVSPAITGRGTLPQRALFWHYPHYHPGGATPYGAVRSGQMRLVEFYESGRRELYDVQADVGETHDLAAAMPEKTAELAETLDHWRTAVGAQMPVPNPAYTPPP